MRRCVNGAILTTPAVTCHDRGVDHPDPVRAISVSAVVLTRPDRAVATVRKLGTARFMLPGGKWEDGESPSACAVREVHEELGVTLTPAELSPLGRFATATANEPGFTLVSEVFAAEVDGHQQPRAEIEEIRWVTPAELEVIAGLAEDDCAPWAPLLVRVARVCCPARFGAGASPERPPGGLRG